MRGHGQLDVTGAILIEGPAPERPKPSGLVEVVRSFSYKLNLKNADGSPTYESCDFFCCSKAQCELDDRDEVSRDLDQFCMDEVLESIREFKERRTRKQAGRAA